MTTSVFALDIHDSWWGYAIMANNEIMWTFMVVYLGGALLIIPRTHWLFSPLACAYLSNNLWCKRPRPYVDSNRSCLWAVIRVRRGCRLGPIWSSWFMPPWLGSRASGHREEKQTQAWVQGGGPSLRGKISSERYLGYQVVFVQCNSESFTASSLILSLYKFGSSRLYLSYWCEQRVSNRHNFSNPSSWWDVLRHNLMPRLLRMINTMPKLPQILRL